MKTSLAQYGSGLLAVVTGALAAQAQVGWSTDARVGGGEFAPGGLSGGLPVVAPDPMAAGWRVASPARLTPSRRRPDLRVGVSAPPGPSATLAGGGGGAGGGPGLAPQAFNFSVNQAIPDGNLSGLANTQTLPSAPNPIQSVAVTLVLAPVGAGGFLGDLYATLTHEGGGYSVLLNRPGRRAGSPFGYSDGLTVNVTLADDAAADIHQYRVALTGSELVPLSGALTGNWQPDGRSTDPLSVQSADPRDSSLAYFAGDNQAGLWTLFVADVSGGGEYRLESWSLSLTLVPEPADAFALLALSALGWVVFQRRASRQGHGAG